jgi:hypothetical protein
MQHATERVERPGESQEALDGKKQLLKGVQSPFVNVNMNPEETDFLVERRFAQSMSENTSKV